LLRSKGKYIRLDPIEGITENEERTKMEDEVVLIAKTVKEEEQNYVVQLTYLTTQGEMAEVVVPLASVSFSIPISPPLKRKGGVYHTLCRLVKIAGFETPGGLFRPSLVFKGIREPCRAEYTDVEMEIVEMAEQGVARENIVKYLKEGETITTGDNNVAIGQQAGEDVWDGALLKGGRGSKVAPWNFIPEFLPNFVFDEAAEKFLRVNKPNGKAASWSIFNPALKSEKRPAGALLGSVSDRYHVLPHPQWVEPMLRYAEMSSIKSSVIAWNDGGRCRVDLDVTQAAQTRQAATAQLKEKGHSFLSLDAFSEAAQSLDGLYKFGFTINNSLDGRGSFSVHGGALRTYCSNLAVAGGIKTALSLRHTKGVMADVDWDVLGLDLVNATAELNEWLVNTELLSWVPMDIQLMDKLMYVMSENNIGLSPPRVTKDKETQEVKNINRSHMDLALANGWKDPNLYYVKSSDAKNTAYHALQCFTGVITHKPTVFDSKRKLDGTALGMDTLDARLKRVNDVFTDLLDNTVLTLPTAGVNLAEKEKFKDYIARENLVEDWLGDIPGYTEVHGISAL